MRRATIGSNNIEYIIDPTGRRIGKRVNGEFYEGFLYQDQLNPIAKVDSQGNVLETYIYGEKAHVPAFISKGGKIYRVISDNLGSVLKVVDIATGTVAQSLTYNTFGEIMSDSNPGFQPFAYAGGLYDIHTGLTRYGARDYNPVTGRWIQKDPIGFAGGDTNLYRYVNNDPLRFIDPQGLKVLPSDIGAESAFYNSNTKQFVPQSEVTDISRGDFFKIVFGIPAFGALGSIGSAIGPTVSAVAITTLTSPTATVNTIDFADNFSGVVGGPTTGLPPLTPGGGAGYGAGVLFNEVKRACE